MIAPSGGNADKTPPIVIKKQKKISGINGEESVLVYEFDERIQAHEFTKNLYVSPPLINTSYTIKNNILIVNIKDSICENVLYSISMDNCIKDVNEGNILAYFKDNFISYKGDSMKLIFHFLKVKIEDAYSRKGQINHWILLYKHNVPDSLIFQKKPDYIAKTDEDGYGTFNNIKDGIYKIISVSGRDFSYHSEEMISFSDDVVVAGQDSSINLFSFNPLQKIDSAIIKKDTASKGGSISVQLNISEIYVVQLLKGEDVVLQKKFNTHSNFKLRSVPPGEYTMKLFLDENENGFWDTGSLEKKKQPEKVFVYPEKITVRFNWDLELDWKVIQ